MSIQLNPDQISIVEKAIEFFQHPESWTQHEMGTGADGLTDLWRDQLLKRNCALPQCLCAEGALWWAAGKLFRKRKATSLVESMLERSSEMTPDGNQLHVWNDAKGRTLQDVVKLLTDLRDAQK